MSMNKCLVVEYLEILVMFGGVEETRTRMVQGRSRPSLARPWSSRVSRYMVTPRDTPGGTGDR